MSPARGIKRSTATTGLPLAASLTVLLLAGCSGPLLHKARLDALPTPTADAGTAATAPKTAPPPEEAAAATAAATRSTTASDQIPMAKGTGDMKTVDSPVATQTEDKDMTVLVLDNPKLLEQAAQLNSRPAETGPIPSDAPAMPPKTEFHYAFDAHRLSAADVAVLRAHGRYLAAHPSLRVKLVGHSDSQGPKDYNLFLSRLRAADAAKVLEAAGAKADQIEIQGVGSTDPQSSVGDFAANRRLEIHYINPALAEAR